MVFKEGVWYLKYHLHHLRVDYLHALLFKKGVCYLKRVVVY